MFSTVGNFSSGFWFIAVQIACWDDTYSCNSNRERGETPYCIYVEWVCTQLYFAFHLKLKNEPIISKPPPGKVQMKVNTWDKAQLITTSIFWKCWAQSMVKSLLGVWRRTGLFRRRGWTRAVLWTACYAGDRPPRRDHSPAVCTRRFPVSNLKTKCKKRNGWSEDIVFWAVGRQLLGADVTISKNNCKPSRVEGRSACP